MKKILLICNYFSPENEIASIRLTKFAKYLIRKGYQVETLVEKKDLELKDQILSSDSKNIPVYYVENSVWMKRLDKVYFFLTKKYREKRYNRISDRTIYNAETKSDEFVPFEIAYPGLGTLDLLMVLLRQYDLFLAGKDFLRKRSKGFDVCFSSYGNYFGHLAGEYFKRMNPEKLWIADFRDPVYRLKFTPKYILPLVKWYENAIYERCDRITVVTEKMSAMIPRKFFDKKRCITNGFDREDRKIAFGLDQKFSDKFSICYTGRMYGGWQDLSTLFFIVRQLIDEGSIDSDHIEFRYAGTGFDIFFGQAAKYALSSYCKNYGFVAREKSLQIQNHSVLLAVTISDYKRRPEGIITGKVLEYMSAGKPIIAIINGDLEKNELADIMRKTKLGCAYEAFYDKRDRENLKKYLKRQYCLFKHRKKIHYSPREAALSKFDYDYLTDQLIEVIESK